MSFRTTFTCLPNTTTWQNSVMPSTEMEQALSREARYFASLIFRNLTSTRLGESTKVRISKSVMTSLCAVSLQMRLEDMGNIDPAQKERLLRHFDGIGKPPIILKTHNENDQGKVQHILGIMAPYASENGRFAPPKVCSKCGIEPWEDVENDECPAPEYRRAFSYLKQPGLDPDEASDASYYQGRGAPVQEGAFKRFNAFSDGCAAQFLCAAFFYFLSLFKSMFGLSISWSWFCSCHRKTGDCDAEGGAVHHLADDYEKEDNRNRQTTDATKRQRVLLVYA